MIKNENYLCTVTTNRASFFLLSPISTLFPLHDLPLHFRSPLQGHAVISNKGKLKMATNDNNAITTGICGLFVLSIFLTLSVTTKTATADGIHKLSSPRVVQ